MGIHQHNRDSLLLKKSNLKSKGGLSTPKVQKKTQQTNSLKHKRLK